MLTTGPKYDLEDAFKLRCEKLSENYRGVVITSSDRYRSTSFGEFKIICLRDPLGKSFISTFGYIFLSIFLLAKAAIAGDRFRLYVTYDPLTTGIVGALVAPLFRARLVVEVNGDYMQDVIYSSIPGFYRRHFRKWLMVTIEKFVLNRATGIKCLYSGQVDAFKPFSNMAKVVNFPNHVNGDGFSNMGETKEVLFAGFPFHIKGVDILIEAFKSIAEKHKDWNLRILGYYPDTTELFSHIDGHPQISYQPPVNHDEMAKHIGHCGIFVLPSRTEAMGRVLVEAMAAGKPRIGANVGGIPTTIEHDVDGVLFEKENSQALAEQLDRLMSDPSLRERLGKNARLRYDADFSQEVYFRSLHKFYSQLLSSR